MVILGFSPLITKITCARHEEETTQKEGQKGVDISSSPTSPTDHTVQSSAFPFRTLFAYRNVCMLMGCSRHALL
jgi:hypothetical protein